MDNILQKKYDACFLQTKDGDVQKDFCEKKVGVVILNYNGWKDTIACAKSVLAGSKKPDWVVIVDNASHDDSQEKIQKWIRENELAKGKQTEVIFHKELKNGGYAAGNNIGIKYLLKRGCEAVWILNNDTIVDTPALEAMEKRLFSKNRPGLCGSLICYLDDPDKIQCRAGGKTNWRTMLSRLNGAGLCRKEAEQTSADEVEKNLNFIYGASVMASRAFLEKIGLMDEKFFLYREEQDWAYRAQGKFDFAYASGAVVWHKGGMTTGFEKSKFKLVSAILLLKSHLRLIIKHNPRALPFAVYALILHAYRKYFIPLCSGSFK